MRLVARISAILAAAMLVVAVAFGLSRTSAAQSWAARTPNHHQITQAAGAGAGSTAAGSTEQRGPGGERRGGGFAAFEVVKNLVIVGLIIAAVALVKRVLPKQRSRRGTKPQSLSALDQAG